MKRTLVLLILAILVILLLPYACASPSPTPPPSSSPTPAASVAPSPLSTSKPATSPASPSPTATPKSTAAPQPYDLRWAAGTTSSSSYQWVITVQQMTNKYAPELKQKIIVTSGAAQGNQMLKDGEVEIGAVPAELDSVKADWWNKTRVLFPWMFQAKVVIVKKNSSIKTWQDLKGKTISPSTKGAVSTIFYERLLTDGSGWVPEDFKLRYASQQDMTAMLREGSVDAIMTYYFPGSPITLEAFTTMDVRVIEIPEDVMNKVLTKYYPANSYVPTTIPAGEMKGTDIPYKTWSTWYVMAIQAGVPDNVVYRLLSAFWDHQDEAASICSSVSLMKPDAFRGPWPIPYHPGSLSYFKDKGWIK